MFKSRTRQQRWSTSNRRYMQRNALQIYISNRFSSRIFAIIHLTLMRWQPPLLIASNYEIQHQATDAPDIYANTYEYEYEYVNVFADEYFSHYNGNCLESLIIFTLNHWICCCLQLKTGQNVSFSANQLTPIHDGKVIKSLRIYDVCRHIKDIFCIIGLDRQHLTECSANDGTSLLKSIQLSYT